MRGRRVGSRVGRCDSERVSGSPPGSGSGCASQDFAGWPTISSTRRGSGCGSGSSSGSDTDVVACSGYSAGERANERRASASCQSQCDRRVRLLAASPITHGRTAGCTVCAQDAPTAVTTAAASHGGGRKGDPSLFWSAARKSGLGSASGFPPTGHPPAPAPAPAPPAARR